MATIETDAKQILDSLFRAFKIEQATVPIASADITCGDETRLVIDEAGYTIYNPEGVAIETGSLD